MIKNSSELIEVLEAAYVKRKENKYTLPMANMIIKEFENYHPESLSKLFSVISRNWEGEFGPPNLASILKIIKEHNERALFDENIRRTPPHRQISPPDEEYINIDEVMRLLVDLKKKKSDVMPDDFYEKMEEIWNAKDKD